MATNIDERSECEKVKKFHNWQKWCTHKQAQQTTGLGQEVDEREMLTSPCRDELVFLKPETQQDFIWKTKSERWMKIRTTPTSNLLLIVCRWQPVASHFKTIRNGVATFNATAIRNVIRISTSLYTFQVIEIAKWHGVVSHGIIRCTLALFQCQVGHALHLTVFLRVRPEELQILLAIEVTFPVSKSHAAKGVVCVDDLWDDWHRDQFLVIEFAVVGELKCVRQLEWRMQNKRRFDADCDILLFTLKKQDF